MHMPDKVTTYDESILPYFSLILGILKNGDTSATKLFATVRNRLSADLQLFVEALDALFALRQIAFRDDTEELTYVGGNSI
ncbi:hypothetical protein FACS1894217_12340 [Clostridia bacterium]|nr:hypothetical protein FACS1894217_12340 [Clostridia bacterium]